MPKLLKNIKLSELSLVDKGANQHSRISITKSASAVIEEKIQKYFVDSIDYSNANYKSIFDQHLRQCGFYEAREKIYPFVDALGDTIAGYIMDSSTTDDDKTAKISLAVSDFLAHIREEVPELTSDEELMEIFEELDEVSAPGSQSDIGKQMVDKVDFEKQLADLTAKLEAEVAKNAELAALAALSDDEKAFVEKMDAGAKKEFMAASADEKKKKMGDVKKNDETLVVDGETISKSAVGEAQFAVFKRLAAAEERIAKAEEAASFAKLEKRATEEFANLPGSSTDIAKALRVIEKADADVSKSMLAIFKAANEANKKAFEKRGGNGGDVEDTPEAKIAKIAEDIAKNEKVTMVVAKSLAWSRNPDLYNEYNSIKD